MGVFLRDLRLALRALRQAPAFAAVAVLTLGLGIGASTSIFSAVDAVLLRPLPFPQSDRLLSVRERNRQFPMMSVCYPDYLDWVAGNHSFAELAVYRGDGRTLTHVGVPAVIPGQDASWQYFSALGVAPERGRTFTAEEDRLGAPAVVVIGDTLWRERFGADPQILGKTIELDAVAYTVIGIMPAGFPGLVTAKDAPQFWISLGAQATKDSGLMERGDHPGLNGIGRLKAGATLTSARADLDRIAAALAQQYPKSNTGEGVAVQPYVKFVTRNSGAQMLWLLLGAVGLVLLIACANVANLLLARAATRQKANAIRAALGASRARLIREHLTESLCLGVAGSALGLAIAELAMKLAPALIPPAMTRANQLWIDGRVLGFTIALALLTTLLFGLAPAWHASQVQVAAVLKKGGRESDTGASGARLRGVLVALEMGLALLLLVGAGLLIRSMVRLEHVDPGFSPHGVLTFEVGLPDAKYTKPEQSLEFFRETREHLRQLPSVTAVGQGYPLPFSGNDWENSFSIVGRPAPPPGQEASTNYAMIGGDYFQAIGMRLLRGRAFADTDTPTSPKVAIIDDSFARKFWPGADPLDAALGQQIGNSTDNAHNKTIVGVVTRVLDYGLDGRDKLPEMFVPVSQTGYNQTNTDFVVRTRAGDPLQMRGAVTAVVQAQDADQPISDLETMDQRISLSLAQQRLTLWLMGAFSVVALALAAIGIYGVLSYAVAQRTHEIGVRMALGADQSHVLALVLRQGLRLALIGAGAGLAAALVLARFAASFLYGISGHDPLTLLAVPLLLLAVAALACYIPARRATRVDPIVALRGE